VGIQTHQAAHTSTWHLQKPIQTQPSTLTRKNYVQTKWKKPYLSGRAFTTGDIQYPSNWLRLASAEEKAAIGITEEVEPTRADDRFYWDGDITNPKAIEDREEVDEDGNPLYVKVLGEVDGEPAMVDTDERLVTKGLKSQMGGAG